MIIISGAEAKSNISSSRGEISKLPLPRRITANDEANHNQIQSKISPVDLIALRKEVAKQFSSLISPSLAIMHARQLGTKRK